MNVTHPKTEASAASMQHDAPAVNLAQLLSTYMPREKLLTLVRETVGQILARHLRNVADPGAPEQAEAGVWTRDGLAQLHQASAIALPPELCTLMARVGFDKSLFTYGQSEGSPAGFAEGCWLLKFIGVADAVRAVTPGRAAHPCEHRQASRAG